MKTINDGTEKIEILLVDDREENLQTLDAVLSSPDYRTTKARSGDEVLRYLLNNEPALILMDVQMPGLSGFETAAIIKKSEHARTIPIIFVTAIDKEERFAHKGYEHGAVDYIFKPFDVHILRSKVAVFAELYRKTQRIVRAERQLRESESRERERKIAELELRGLRREQTEQKKYRDLVEGIHHGIVWSASPDSLALTFVSPTAERLLGFSSSFWLHDPDFWRKHLHADDVGLFHSACNRAIRDKVDVSLEHRFIKADGQAAWLHTGLRYAQSDENGSYELRGLSVDVTRLKDAEGILELNKQRSDFLAGSSLLLSESFDYRHTLRELGGLAVARFTDLFSIDLFDSKGRLENLALTQKATRHARHAENFHRKFILNNNASYGWQKALLSGRPELYLNADVLSREVREHMQNLDLKSILIVPLTIRGQTIGALSLASECQLFDHEDIFLANDLANRVALAVDNSHLYKSAQASIRIRDEFLSVASHELKTPLTPLKLQIQSLMRTLKHHLSDSEQGEKVTKMLDSSNRQIEKLSRLIDDLLDISQISMGKLNLHVEEFDLIKLLGDILQHFENQLLNSKCKIELTAPRTLIVKLDQFRIEQVIVNLLTNAMKYAPGKPIRIVVRETAGTVMLSMSDQGIGIDKADQGRIFMRFERAVSGNHFGGLGLGLYIVRQILEAHGGRIAVDSEVGKGSTFTLETPRIVSPEACLNLPHEATQLPVAALQQETSY